MTRPAQATGHEKGRAAAIDWHKPVPRVCPVCGHQPEEHRRFDKLYHSTSPAKRHSIRDTGLRAEFDRGEGYTEPGIYMSPKPDRESPSEDVWEVDARGLRVHPDTDGQMYEFRDMGGSYFSKEDIGPERLRLHRAGLGDKWIGFPPKEAAYYHGTMTELSEGQYLRSPMENRRVHFTTDPEQAWLWGTDSEGPGPVRVYEVHPEGDVEEGRGRGGYASRDPVRIGREVQQSAPETVPVEPPAAQRAHAAGLAARAAQLDVPEGSPVTTAGGPPRPISPGRPGRGVARGHRPRRGSS